MLVAKRLSSDVAVDWSAPRLLCIAGDFTRYDEHAVEQINRSIELIRYRQYGDELLLFELVNAPGGTGATGGSTPAVSPSEKNVAQYLAQASPVLVERYKTLEEFALSLGDDVTKKVEELLRVPTPQELRVHRSASRWRPLTRVREGGPRRRPADRWRHSRCSEHRALRYGDLEIRVTADDHLDVARELIARSYEVS